MAKKEKAPNPPPKGKLARSKLIGQVAAGAAGKKLKSELVATFQSAADGEQTRAQAQAEIAEMVFAGLSQLRGTALKLAQVFCADTGLLPDAYLRKFEQAHYRVPGLSAPLVRGVLRRELKREPEEIFARFEWQSAAAASLGQVHRAVLKNGDEVAVKVQYPGMQDSLRSDMGLARLALRPLLRTRLILSTLEQIETRLMEETDYRRELENLNEIRSRRGIGVVVPRAYEEFTTSRVLTMQWMSGEPIDLWAESAPDRVSCDRAAQTIFDLFLRGVFEHGRFHADANLGNFLVSKEHGLVLLDFGAVTSLPLSERRFYARLWAGDENRESLVREYQERGAVTDARFFETCVQPYLNWSAKLMRTSQFDVGAHPEFVADGYKLFSSQMMNPQLQNYRDELVSVHRTLLAVFTLSLKLRARLDVELLHSCVSNLVGG